MRASIRSVRSILPRSLLAALLAVATMAAGCAGTSQDPDEDGETDSAALRPLERRAVGLAAKYPADLGLRARTAELARSHQARRQVAWEAVRKVLVSVAVPGSGSDAPEATRASIRLPAFRTWYGRDDFERVFARLAREASAKGERSFTPDAIARAFDWNATTLGASSEADFFARLEAAKDDGARDGLAGNARVSYSAAFLEHVIRNHARLADCAAKGPDRVAADAPPAGVSAFAPCIGEEFPPDAAVVKMSWARAAVGDERLAIPMHDTSASALAAKRDARSQGEWTEGAREAIPAEGSIYTVKMADGATFAMPAMHLVTKELRDWMWITLWWSPAPNEDFGADRPRAIAELPGPWRNYKMSVVVAYEEGDPDPRGGFSGSLGDALAAANAGGASAGTGGATWTSNPYLERGAHNARTNCIGCHQHGGTSLTSESILGAPDRFPSEGRTRVRETFPADYSFALTGSRERLAGVVESWQRVLGGTR